MFLGWGTRSLPGCSQGLHTGEKRKTSFCQCLKSGSSVTLLVSDLSAAVGRGRK